MFQLSKDEWDALRSQIATIKGRGQHPKYLPFVFTEYGVVMAAAALKTEVPAAGNFLQGFIGIHIIYVLICPFPLS